MPGNTIGGQKAAATNKKLYGEDFYQRIALKAQSAWEANGRKPRGFAHDRDLARRAGSLGGRRSRK